MSALVLGCGNVLLGDEGVGVWAVSELRRSFVLDPPVAVLEGGTLGLDLLPHLEGVGRLLLVDAIRSGAEAGTILRFEGEDVAGALETKMSSHQIGIQDLLAAADLLGRRPREVVLWGVEAGPLAPGTGFSPAVERARARLLASVIGELRAWGVEALARAAPSAEPTWWRPRAAASPRRPRIG